MALWAKFAGWVGQSGIVSPEVWRRLPNLVYPPRCPACDAAVGENGALCADCWNAISFIDGALCDQCGQPFELDPGEGALCASCLASPPVYDRARAVFVYDEVSRPLITGFKYGDRTERVPGFGRWLARAGRDLVADSDVIVPIPLHRKRLFTRRFNQAGLMAQALAKETLVPVLLDGLERRKSTQQQVGLTHAKRRRNVKGAFRVPEDRRAAIAGQRILLLDDVVTSGATVEAATKVLKKAGATAVFVLSLARVPAT